LNPVLKQIGTSAQQMNQHLSFSMIFRYIKIDE